VKGAVFLDRDGVINRVVFRDGKPGSPRSLEEFEFESGVESALTALHRRSWQLYVVTNQPDLARGLLDQETSEAITRRVLERLPVRRVLICGHDDRDECDCRKPKPGLLLRVKEEDGIDLGSSWMIGDSARDAGAARSAGCMSIIISRHYNLDSKADFRVATIGDAVELIGNSAME